MFGFGKSPANNKATKQSSVNPPASSTSNPFDSDDESNAKQTLHLGKRASSESMLNVLDNAFNDKDRYKNDFRDSGGLENQSVQELEKYAAYKAEETTNSVNNCLRIAEDIKQPRDQHSTNFHVL
jgi:synaptosomal-associated protein 25